MWIVPGRTNNLQISILPTLPLNLFPILHQLLQLIRLNQKHLPPIPIVLLSINPLFRQRIRPWLLLKILCKHNIRLYNSTVFDCDPSRRWSFLLASTLDKLEGFDSLDNSSKDYVVVIEPVALSKGDVELGVVCVLTAVSHGDHVRLIVFMDEVFVWKGWSIYRLASCSIIEGGIASLHHKPRDYSMKNRSFIMELLFRNIWFFLFPGAQSSKVLRSFRGIREKMDPDFTYYVGVNG